MTTKTVGDYINGDVTGAPTIYATPHDELASSVAGQELVLTRQAVIRVLQDLRSGRVAPADVQQWASFVRRGFTTLARGPLRPLNIEYEPQFEDDIVEAVGRMDEIGDIIDGELSVDEIDEHLARLGA